MNYNPPASTGTPLSAPPELPAGAGPRCNPSRRSPSTNTYLLDRDRAAPLVWPPVPAPRPPLAFEIQTLRTKLNYQFTRAFSARVIVEYDSTLVNPLQTSLPRTKTVSTSALLTWLPHPGTAIYFGYKQQSGQLRPHPVHPHDRKFL